MITTEQKLPSVSTANGTTMEEKNSQEITEIEYTKKK
jgi:hypothetical protein